MKVGSLVEGVKESGCLKQVGVDLNTPQSRVWEKTYGGRKIELLFLLYMSM